MTEPDASPGARARCAASLVAFVLPLLRRVGAWVLTLAIIVLALLLTLHMIGFLLGLVVLACLGLCLVTLWWPEESRMLRQWLCRVLGGTG